MRTDLSGLTKMLQYELHSAERYRRFVSVMMVAPGDALDGLGDFLAGHCRTSDVMAESDEGVTVLMGETDTPGALTAAKRYQGFFGDQVDLRFSIATYPADAGRAKGLIEKASQRLERALNDGEGAVVTSG